MRKFVLLAGLFGMLVLAGAGAAGAHARLTAADPMVNATVVAPRQLVLRFSEKLVGGFSGFEVTAANGAKVPVAAALGKDGLSLVGVPARPLAAGVYKISWHVVTSDSHRMQGEYSFKVR